MFVVFAFDQAASPKRFDGMRDRPNISRSSHASVLVLHAQRRSRLQPWAIVAYVISEASSYQAKRGKARPETDRCVPESQVESAAANGMQRTGRPARKEGPHCKWVVFHPPPTPLLRLACAIISLAAPVNSRQQALSPIPQEGDRTLCSLDCCSFWQAGVWRDLGFFSTASRQRGGELRRGKKLVSYTERLSPAPQRTIGNVVPATKFSWIGMAANSLELNE
jgi:hypothetical protein